MIASGAMVALMVLAATPELDLAEKAFDEGRFQDALVAVYRALDKPLPKEERLRAYHLKALTHAAFDDGPSAVEAFRRALGEDPTFTPGPDAGPKVSALFAEARKKGPTTVVLTPEAPRLAPVEPRPAPVPVLKSGWFWGVVVGVVVVGVGTAVTIAVWPKTPQVGNLGRSPLP